MLCGGSIALQADTVTLASGMPLEFPAPPSLQILAIARYRCGLRLVWHENPSLLFVPPRMKHYTRTLMVGACTTSQSRGRYKQIRSHSQSPGGLLLATSAVKPSRIPKSRTTDPHSHRKAMEVAVGWTNAIDATRSISICRHTK